MRTTKTPPLLADAAVAQSHPKARLKRFDWYILLIGAAITAALAACGM